jgi:hypothetical protein
MKNVETPMDTKTDAVMTKYKIFFFNLFCIFFIKHLEIK